MLNKEKYDMVIGKVDTNKKAFIVAELSGNHGGDINKAYKLIKAAADASADAVKLQTYTPDTITLNSNKSYFHTNINGLWAGKTLYQLYSEAYTPWSWHKELKDYAESLGLEFFSTPFDITSADYLEELGIPCYKISSFEINDLYLIEHIAKKQKPILLSLGLAEEHEIWDAVNTIRYAGNNQICLLKCTSSYPASISDANIIMIKDIKERFQVEAGISDHTLGYSVAVGAFCLGARVIEKHVVLDKNDNTVDAGFSMTPDEFHSMVKMIREIELAYGCINYTLSLSQKNQLMDRRSLFTSKSIKKGEYFTEDNIKSVRPGYGISTKYYKEIIGKKAVCDIDYAEPLQDYMINWNDD